MVYWSELKVFARELADDFVVSAYISRSGTDAGGRGAWRKRLAAAAREARSSVEGSGDSFDQAWDRVEEAIAPLGRVLPHPGLVVFATSDALVHSGALLHEPTTVVSAGEGPSLAPYLPSLVHDRGVTAVLVDRRRARLFTYRGGRLTEAESVVAESEALDDVGSGASKRAGTTTGNRGATRTDAANQAHEAAESRFLHDVAQAALSMNVASDGFVVGGSRRPATALRRMLMAETDQTVLELIGGSVTDDAEHLDPRVGEAALSIATQRQSGLLEAAFDSHGGDGVGWDNVQRALRDGAVETLLIAEAALPSAADEVDELLAQAIQKGAGVEVVRGEPGTRLVGDAKGVAAVLRFHPVTTPVP